MTFKVKSLDRPIMPAGFLFAIVSETGQVLYHSDPAKQLSENLLSEFSGRAMLKAAIQTRSEVFFSTRYAAKNYAVFVRPISGLPYHLVIFEDHAFTSLRNINNFSFCFFMLFGFFILLSTELLVVFLVSYKKTYYKKQYFDISWIGPNRRFHTEYNIAAIGNILGIILLLSMSHWADFLQFLFMLLVAGTIIVAFLHYLYRAAYLEAGDRAMAGKKTNAIIALGIMLVLSNIFALKLAGYLPILGFQVVFLVFLAGTVLFYKIADAGGWTAKKPYWDFSCSFSLMTFTRLILGSGLPVAAFYIATSTYQVKLVTRYLQTEFVKSLQQDVKSAGRGVYADGVWVESVSTTAHPDHLQNDVKVQNTNFLFRRLMIYDDVLVPGIRELDRNAADKSFMYSSLFVPGQGTTYFQYKKGQYFRVASTPLSYSLPNPLDRRGGRFKGWVYWIGFLAALGGFWYLVHHILRKLFALNMTSEAYWDHIDTLLLTDNTLNSLVFLIGPPGSGKLEKVKALIGQPGILGKDEKPIVYDKDAPENNTCYVADMILLPTEGDTDETKADWAAMISEMHNEKYKLIIINHFEYDIRTPETNSTKLNLLESLLQKNKSKLLIISTVHPVNFLDSLNQQEYNKPEMERKPGYDLERWHVLLGHFNIAVSRLMEYANPATKESLPWEEVLRYETRNTHFLNRLRDPIRAELAKDDASVIDGESLSAKLGVTAHYFYMYMWQSLTKEEKFLLYDLAEDGLVNPYDNYNLTLLISKGLIIREYNILKLFNHEFRNFILTAIGQMEAMQIQAQIKDTGNWSKLKTPILILIIAVLVFLFTSQKETYSTLFEYLAIIGAGVPILLNAASLLKPGAATQ
jgi:hypothetical protein